MNEEETVAVSKVIPKQLTSPFYKKPSPYAVSQLKMFNRALNFKHNASSAGKYFN